MSAEFPRTRVLRASKSEVLGIEITATDGGSPVFSIPFRKTISVQVAAANPDIIFAINYSRGSQDCEGAWICARTGQVVDRISLGRNHILCADRKKSQYHILGSTPYLQTLDARRAEYLHRYDLISKVADQFRLRSNDGHDDGLDNGISGLVIFRFEKPAQITPMGSILTILHERRIGQAYEAKHVVDLCPATGTAQILYSRLKDRKKHTSAGLPGIVIRPDGSIWLEFHGDRVEEILGARFDHASNHRHVLITGRASPDCSADFDAFADAARITPVAVKDWSVAACRAALEEIQKLILTDLDDLTWQEAVEFRFQVEGEPYDEGEFFDQLLSRRLPIEDSLRELIKAFITACNNRPFSGHLLTHAPSVSSGEYPVIPTLGPAFRALLLLDPSSIGLFDCFRKTTDQEHETYLGPVALADFARQHGWTTEKSIRICLGYMRNCENRGPNGFRGFGLFSDASRFLEAREFALIVCSEICSSADYSDCEDHEISDFIREYEQDDYWHSVLAAINDLIGRKVKLDYWRS